LLGGRRLTSSTLSVTTTGTAATLGAVRPARSAAAVSAGTMCSASAFGPARNGSVPSASSPVTCGPRGPIAATITGISGSAPATAVEPTGRDTTVSPW